MTKQATPLAFLFVVAFLALGWVGSGDYRNFKKACQDTGASEMLCDAKWNAR